MGVYTPLVNVTASIEVSEVIRILTGKEPHLAGKLLHLNLSDLSFEEILLARNPKCLVCGDATDQEPPPLKERLIEKQITKEGKGTIIVTPKEWIQLDLKKVEGNIKSLGYQFVKKGLMSITFKDHENFVISLLNTGVAIFQIPPNKMPKYFQDNDLSFIKKFLMERLKISERVYSFKVKRKIS